MVVGVPPRSVVGLSTLILRASKFEIVDFERVLLELPRGGTPSVPRWTPHDCTQSGEVCQLHRSPRGSASARYVSLLFHYSRMAVTELSGSLYGSCRRRPSSPITQTHILI